MNVILGSILPVRCFRCGIQRVHIQYTVRTHDPLTTHDPHDSFIKHLQNDPHDSFIKHLQNEDIFLLLVVCSNQ